MIPPALILPALILPALILHAVDIGNAPAVGRDA